MTKRTTRISRRTATVGDKVSAELADFKQVATITTAIHIPKETWILLRAVAFRRAQESGGRASVSKLISQIVERCRLELERELSIDN